MSHNKRYPVIMGEVLFDSFPDGTEVLGGAPFNVAWHLQAFGQDPLFISRVGSDPLGHAIRTAMEKWDMTTAGLQVDSNHPTGTVKVHLKNNEATFEIVEDRAYDHINADTLPSIKACSLLYHGSLALRNAESRTTLNRLKQKLNSGIFVDVNLRPPWWEKDSVCALLKEADWVKLNVEELRYLAVQGEDDAEKAEILQKWYEIDLLFVTRGSEGSSVRTAEGDTVEVNPVRNLEVVDTVGAGDAFASILLLGLINEWPLQLTMERAQSFASAIVGVRGATVMDLAFYKPFLKDWSNYEQ